MISFVNAQGSVKIRLPCSKAMVLTTLSSNIATHPNGYTKVDKYVFYTRRYGSLNMQCVNKLSAVNQKF